MRPRVLLQWTKPDPRALTVEFEPCTAVFRARSGEFTLENVHVTTKQRDLVSLAYLRYVVWITLPNNVWTCQELYMPKCSAHPRDAWYPYRVCISSNVWRRWINLRQITCRLLNRG